MPRLARTTTTRLWPGSLGPAPGFGRGGTSTDQGQEVALDTDGNIYLAGNFASLTATFGTAVLTQTTSISVLDPPTDIFVARLDAAGNWLWILLVRSNFGDNSVGLVVDGSGTVTSESGSMSRCTRAVSASRADRARRMVLGWGLGVGHG